MGSREICLHLCFFLPFTLCMSFSSAHRASLTSITLEQAPSPSPNDGACCSFGGVCSSCNGAEASCCEFLGVCYTCINRPLNGVDSSLTLGKVKGVKESVVPNWVLDHQGSGQEINEPDPDYPPDWNPLVGDMGEVRDQLITNTILHHQQRREGEVNEPRAWIPQQEGHPGKVGGGASIHTPPPQH